MKMRLLDITTHCEERSCEQGAWAWRMGTYENHCDDCPSTEIVSMNQKIQFIPG